MGFVPPVCLDKWYIWINNGFQKKLTQAQIKSFADTVFSLKLLKVKRFDKTLYDIVKGLNVYKTDLNDVELAFWSNTECYKESIFFKADAKYQYKYRFEVLDSESIDVKMCVKVPLSGVIMTYV